MKTQPKRNPPPTFQDGGKILTGAFAGAACMVALAVSSISARAEWPWFSGFVNTNNSYRIFAHTDWDAPLFGAGIDPDSDCLGIQAPQRRVDGHVVYEADGTGNCVVIEATGSFSSMLGSVDTVVSVQYMSDPYVNPPSAPASDTRHDYNGNFLNILSDPVSSGPKMSIRVSEVEVCWTSLTNATYRVEYRSDLTTNTWVTLTNCVPSAGTETCIYDKVLRGQPQRFYRVVATNCVAGP
jgi:hypothetical protein